MLLILVLLGSLAYGSYAFGKFVLSNKLFDDEVVPKPSSGLRAVSQSTKVAETITRQNNQKGRTPKVRVKVLSVDDAGPGPEPPALDKTEPSTPRNERVALDNSSDEDTSSDTDFSRPVSRITPPPTSRPLGTRRFDEGRLSIGDDGEFNTRRRRRRRRRTTESTTRALAAREQESQTQTGDDEPARAADTDSSDSQSSYERSERSGSESSSRERPRSRRRSTSSERRRPRNESPIPRPEGSSSGESSGDDSSSPIPQPE